MRATDYTEDALIERPSIELLGSLGWQTANLFGEKFSADGTEGRVSEREIILKRRLRAALEKLNPALSSEAYEQAVQELARDRSAMIPVNANQEISCRAAELDIQRSARARQGNRASRCP